MKFYPLDTLQTMFQIIMINKGGITLLTTKFTVTRVMKNQLSDKLL